ncbi:MAG TPA: hypothetical protein VGP07_22460, partial [Polyangia bacterium]
MSRSSQLLAVALALTSFSARAFAQAPTPGPAAPPEQAAPPAIEILYHADLDGRLATPACAGAAKREGDVDYATLLGRLAGERADGSRPVTLLGGNIATPDLFGAGLVERGPAGIEALAALLARGQYDAIAFGHHELSMTPEALGQLARALVARGMPVVATNLRCDARARGACPDVRPSVLVRRGELSLGIVATISPTVVPGIPAASFKGLTLDDPAPAARAAIRALRARGARYVILMAQGPRDATSLDQVDALARKLAGGPRGEGPDVILAGGLAGEGAERPMRALYRDGVAPIAGSPTGTAGLTRLRLGGGDASPVIDTLASAGATPDADAAARLAAELTAACARYGAAAAPGPV